MRNKKNLYIFLTIFIVVLDQISKILVASNFTSTTCITVIPHLFDFVFVKNTGAAFSMFSGRTAILGILSVAFCIALAWYWIITRPKSVTVNICYSLLLAGAFGNAIDRVIRGSVVDFIQATFIDFPVFNIADIAITMSATILVIYFVFFDKDGQKDGKNNSVGM